MIYIVMGVSGCGKSSIGRRLAQTLGAAFHDADDFHPQSNIRKMSQGFPLDDDDRRPWLNELNRLMTGWARLGVTVLACSALKQRYREQLCEGFSHQQVRFVYLKGTYNLILARMNERTEHFMQADMLQSQFDALEVPTHAIEVEINQSPQSIVEAIVKQIPIAHYE